MIGLVERPIDPAAAIASVSGADAGAVALFVGTVRNENRGRRVLFLEYQAYAPMAEKVMAGIAAEIQEQFGPCRVTMVHRTGRVEIGEVSVVVGVAAAHREPALAGCRHGIERLKSTVPIWKKEHFEGGEAWIEGAGEAPRPAGAPGPTGGGS